MITQNADLNSVIIITCLRIQALHSVNSTDFTYSKGYLALLSTLGALLSIITGCAPTIRFALRRMKVGLWIPSYLRSFRTRIHRFHRSWFGSPDTVDAKLPSLRFTPFAPFASRPKPPTLLISLTPDPRPRSSFQEDGHEPNQTISASHF